MKHIHRVFLLFLTLTLVPLRAYHDQTAQQIAQLQETIVTLSKQITVLTNSSAAANKLPFYRVRSLHDLGVWTWQNKYSIAQMTIIIIALCAVKRKLKPQRSTEEDVVIQRALATGRVRPVDNAPENETDESTIGLLADKIGDFGLYVFEKGLGVTKKITTSGFNLASNYFG